MHVVVEVACGWKTPCRSVSVHGGAAVITAILSAVSCVVSGQNYSSLHGMAPRMQAHTSRLS
jgi:hypothetical protein